MLTANADVVKEQMDKGLIDVGLLLEPVDMDKYDHIRLPEREEWGVLMRPDDALAGRKCLTAEELSALPLILPRRLSVQSELANWFGSAYSRLNICFTSNLSTNSSLMVRQGLGYAIVIHGSLPLLDETKMAFRPLSPALWTTSVLAWRRQQPFRWLPQHLSRFSKTF